MDAILDRMRIVLLSAAIAWGGLKGLDGPLLALALLLYLGVNNLIILSRRYQERTLVHLEQGKQLSSNLVLEQSDGLLRRWLYFCDRKNIVPYYHDIELDALVFVIGPLIGQTLNCTILAAMLGTVLVVALNFLFLRSLLRLERGVSGVKRNN